jgi:hypothetical protein
MSQLELEVHLNSITDKEAFEDFILAMTSSN